MEFFGISVFSSLSQGPLIAVGCVLFVLGLIFIIKGGDMFVDAASWFAEKTGIPKFIIGATIVSFATTLPEMLVSVRASMQGSTEMAIGNAVGSVTANTTLIMGISLCAAAGAVEKKSFRFKGAMFLLSSVLLVVLCIKGALPVWAAAIFWAIFIAFMGYNIYEGKKSLIFDDGVNDEEDKKEFKGSVGKNIMFFIVGAAGIVLGAEFLVGSGKFLARQIGISESIIGFTVIALGTSLPELITMITAVRKKEASLSVGNIVGANVFDLTLILPLCAVISGKPLPVERVNLVFDFPVCILASAVAVIPAAVTGKFKKWQGYALLTIYVAYLVCLVLNETGALTLG